MQKIVKEISDLVHTAAQIDSSLFDKYNVKRGLRNSDGSGVLVGLTKVGNVVGYIKENDLVKPVEGDLHYRGYAIEELVKGFQKEKRYGFEETTYLLLTNKLPNKEELARFTAYLADQRELENSFLTMILSRRGTNMMNMLSRSILVLYSQDETVEDYALPSLVGQSLSLIAKMPSIIAYSYYGMRHAYYKETLYIRHPKAELSTAENFLYLLKGKEYTQLEVELLDLSMVLHAEHGGGNNSSFTTRLVSSSMTDTYSAIAAAIGSLKGRLHGGANLKVLEMMDDIKANVKDWGSDSQVEAYLEKIIKKEAFDKSGKVYGIGHAVYTLSDPRAILLKERARELAKEKGVTNVFDLYDKIEKLTPKIFARVTGYDKVISANVDFYSGFVYEAIGLPKELFTPIFALARISGWSAHRLEEVSFPSRRIIRPAYKSVAENGLLYTPMSNRDNS